MFITFFGLTHVVLTLLKNVTTVSKKTLFFRDKDQRINGGKATVSVYTEGHTKLTRTHFLHNSQFFNV
jgi:hypothetical protein